MRRAALKDIQLYRANLAAEVLLDSKLKRLSGAGEVLVPENIRSTALRALADIVSVCAAQPLGYRNNDIRVTLERRADILIEAVEIKAALRQIYEVGLAAAVEAGQPR